MEEKNGLVELFSGKLLVLLIILAVILITLDTMKVTDHIRGKLFPAEQVSETKK